MTEESDPFCMLLSACRGMTGCSWLRPEMIVRMKKFLQQRFSIVQKT